MLDSIMRRLTPTKFSLLVFVSVLVLTRGRFTVGQNDSIEAEGGNGGDEICFDWVNKCSGGGGSSEGLSASRSRTEREACAAPALQYMREWVSRENR